MSENSSRLSLPFIMPAQAQKHVTHNEALQKLDVLVQTVVEAFDATDPPAEPTEGTTWALGTAPTAAWSGQAHHLATWTNGAWLFVALQQGFTAIEQGGDELMIWDGTTWTPTEISELSNLTGLGVNTTHDPTNRLSVSSPATLLSHEGADHQVKVNKAAQSDTASLLFQTNWSGRAEMGTAGSDDFVIKVSADGTTWSTGISIAAATGELTAPSGMVVDGQITGTAVTQSSTDSTANRLLKTGDFGLGEDAGPLVSDLDMHFLSGMYYFYGGSHTNAASGNNPYPTWSGAAGLLCGNGTLGGTDGYCWQMAINFSAASAEVKMRSKAASSVPFTDWATFHTTENTTVDANGFIKEASPIVRLFDGGIDMPCVAMNAQFTRIGVGRYCLENVDALAQQGWQIEVPQDVNGNRLVFVETEYDPDQRRLMVHTSATEWRGAWVAGAPVDIPAGRWIDLRFDQATESSDPDL